MNQFAFADAVRPAPCRILRLPMLPYSVGHELLLQAERNPFAASPEKVHALSLEARCLALLKAVLICSRPYADYGRKHRWLKLWTRLLSDEDYFVGGEVFQHYRALGCTFPKLADTEIDERINGKQEGRKRGADITAGMVNFLSTRCQSLGFKTVFEVPYGLGLHLYFTDMEAEGALHIENDMERQAKKERDDIIKDVERERAEAAAKAKEAECPA